MKRTKSAPIDPAVKFVKQVNTVLDREWQKLPRLCWASDRIDWMFRFHKAPSEVVLALADKCTALFNGIWYGDEPQERIITAFIANA